MSEIFHLTDSYGDVIPVRFRFGYYNNRNLYVALESYDEELEDFDSYCSLTYNDLALPYLHAAIDITFNGAAKLRFITENNIGTLTGQFIKTSTGDFPIVKFSEEFIRERDISFLKAYQKANGIIGQEKGNESLEAKIHRSRIDLSASKHISADCFPKNTPEREV